MAETRAKPIVDALSDGAVAIRCITENDIETIRLWRAREDVRKGDYITLLTMLAGRDPKMFPSPEKLDLTRQNTNRHLAFGTGPHNCMGSHLARKEIKLTVDYWLDHMPPFRIGEGEQVETHGGSVFGVDVLPLAWD